MNADKKSLAYPYPSPLQIGEVPKKIVTNKWQSVTRNTKLINNNRGFVFPVRDIKWIIVLLARLMEERITIVEGLK